MAEFKTVLFEQMIRDFAENEVKPLAQLTDEEERFPIETVAKMAKLGLFGIIIPTEYGGAGAGSPFLLTPLRGLLLALTNYLFSHTKLREYLIH